MIDTLLITLTLGSALLVVYHHVGYPLILRLLHRRLQREPISAAPRRYTMVAADAQLPRIAIVIPAYNEARWIAEKIRNLAALDYPSERLHIVIACDGCKDDTANIARRTSKEAICEHLHIEVREFTRNRGKVALINEVVGSLDSELVALSDVSALISVDALLLAAESFKDPRVGVLNSHYRLFTPGSPGEAAYWDYQSRIKSSEASLGATLGAHGAFYLFRRALFQPLPEDTINDDFVLPMEIVARGFRAEQDSRITALELESSDEQMDQARRRRISAGNMQQLLRLKRLLRPSYRGVAFAFASGKGLRVLMPLLMVVSLLGSLWLAPGYPLFAGLAALQLLAYALAALQLIFKPRNAPRPLRALGYLVSGHFAGLVGAVRYLLGLEQGRWQRINATGFQRKEKAAVPNPYQDIDPFTARSKRLFDLGIAGFGLLLALPLFPLIALAIKLDSPGPVLFRQMRIGKAMPDHVQLFEMIKFRTMVSDAEKASGATWAKKRDPRITRVGNFLRKTRLDEIPQLINVLRGEMSIIGPRPERPGFYARLESAIPFFAERTYGVVPGITGLAQVNQGYDTCIEDVRSKVGFDHRYAMALAHPLAWLKMDLSIIARTVLVMVTGRGQ